MHLEANGRTWCYHISCSKLLGRTITCLFQRKTWSRSITKSLVATIGKETVDRSPSNSNQSPSRRARFAMWELRRCGDCYSTTTKRLRISWLLVAIRSCHELRLQVSDLREGFSGREHSWMGSGTSLSAIKGPTGLKGIKRT
jgi:hypothetical protein